MNRPFLSICIPTYNRGKLAYQLVQELLQLSYEDKIEIIISNNGSTVDREEYNKIEKLKDKRLHYHKFDKNMDFVGNFNQVLKISNGEFSLLLSDEDHLVKENLDWYMKYLEEHRELAVIWAGTTSVAQYSDMEVYCKKGMEAIKELYLYGNYISGTIYNRFKITNGLLDNLRKSYSNNYNWAYCLYPHMFVSNYAILNWNVSRQELLLVKEGRSDLSTNHGLLEKLSDDCLIVHHATYESRCKQQMGHVEFIHNCKATTAEKLQMFMLLCEKTVYLIRLISDKYRQNNYDMQIIKEAYIKQVVSDIDFLDIPELNADKELWIEYAKQLADEHIIHVL